MREAVFFIFAALVALEAAPRGEAQTNGTESGETQLLPQSIVLVRKAAAPSGAEGSLELQLSNNQAGVQWVMTFDLQGLSPGTYRVEGLRRADGIPNELSHLAIHDPDVIPDVEAGDSRKEDSAAHQSEGVKSRITIVIPLLREAGEIRYIRLRDAGGTVLLEGTLKGRGAG